MWELFSKNTPWWARNLEDVSFYKLLPDAWEEHLMTGHFEVCSLLLVQEVQVVRAPSFRRCLQRVEARPVALREGHCGVGRSASEHFL